MRPILKADICFSYIDLLLCTGDNKLLLSLSNCKDCKSTTEVLFCKSPTIPFSSPDFSVPRSESNKSASSSTPGTSPVYKKKS